jgi:hypothetical protein
MREYTTREIDQRFALLDRYVRRSIVHFLRESEENQVPISELVSHLQRQDPTTDEDEKIAINLQHNHLPKLASIDALEYDARSETVRYHGDDLVEALLESTPEKHRTEP